MVFSKQKKIKLNSDYIMIGSIIIIFLVICYQLSQCKECLDLNDSNKEDKNGSEIGKQNKTKDSFKSVIMKGNKFGYNSELNNFDFISDDGKIDIHKIDIQGIGEDVALQ